MKPIRQFLSDVRDTTLFMTIMLWVCAVPFVLLLTVPFLGWQVGLLAAVVALLIALLICYAICYFPKISMEDKANVTRPSMR